MTNTERLKASIFDCLDRSLSENPDIIGASVDDLAGGVIQSILSINPGVSQEPGWDVTKDAIVLMVHEWKVRRKQLAVFTIK